MWSFRASTRTRGIDEARRAANALLLCAAGSLAVAGADLRAQTKSQELTVRADTVLVRSFMGFGVQLDPYEYRPSDAGWQQITERLDELHPAFLRVMFHAGAYCLRADAHGCARYVWQQQDQSSAGEYGQILRILDYAESRRIPVMIGEWTWPHLPHDDQVGGFKGPDDPRWPEIIAPFLAHLTGDKHYTVLRFYNYMNEPNGAWMWPGGRAAVSYTAWKNGYLHARQVFDAAGLQNIVLVGPDNSGDWNWIDDAVRDTASATGGWEMHWYPKDDEVTSGAVYALLREKKAVVDRGDPEAASKPIFLGESGLITGRVNGDQQPRVRTFQYGVLMADYAAQVAQAGWMGASAWDLDDAMHTVKEDHPAVPNSLTLKTWGFWNSEALAMGTPKDAGIRPWFKMWSLLTHFFPAGSQLVRVSDPASSVGVRSVAAQSRVNGGPRWSVLLVNDHASAVDVVLHLPEMNNAGWGVYRYTAADAQWRGMRPEGVLEPNGRSVKVSLPANSVAVIASQPE